LVSRTLAPPQPGLLLGWGTIDFSQGELQMPDFTRELATTCDTGVLSKESALCRLLDSLDDIGRTLAFIDLTVVVHDSADHSTKVFGSPSCSGSDRPGHCRQELELLVGELDKQSSHAISLCCKA